MIVEGLMSAEIELQEKRFTAEEFARLRIDGPCELVDGKVVRTSLAAARHGLVVGYINAVLARYVAERGLGMVTSGETGFLVRRNPDAVRAPDLAFLSNETLARAKASLDKETFIPGAPDLAVEVLSPDDSWTQIEKKVREYLSAQSKLVWVVNPVTETVHVYGAGRQVSVLERGDEIEGGTVLPGFRVAVAVLFGESRTGA